MKRKKSDGFTLIELLVVVAIIAILAGLLSPGLKAARDQAKSIGCMNNLKQMMLAYNMYADDNDDFLPNTGYTSGPPPYGFGSSNGGWTEAIRPYLKQAYPKYITPECPADNNGVACLSVIRLGYAANDCILPYWAGTSGSIPWIKRGQLSKPSSTMILLDGFGSSDPPDYASPDYYSPAGHYHHHNGLNVIYADGHAAWHAKPVPSSRYDVFWDGD